MILYFVFYLTDYLRWADNFHSENRTTSMTNLRGQRNSTVAALHQQITYDHNLSSPIIPADGVYQVYAQITWSGKVNLSSEL